MAEPCPLAPTPGLPRAIKSPAFARAQPVLVNPMKSNPPSASPTPAETQVILQRLVVLYAQEFSQNQTVRDTLAQRGLSNLALLEHHKVGYCAGHLNRILNDPAQSGKLQAIGILDKNGKEPFDRCVVLPQFTPDGVIAGLWAVPLKGGAPRFLPGFPHVFWNAAAAKLSSRVLLTDCPLDALALMAAGFKNAMAVPPGKEAMDTSSLEQQGVQQLFLVVGDASPNSAFAKTAESKLKPYRPAVVTLAGHQGPLAFLKANGEKALAEAVTAGMHGLVATAIPGMRARPDGFSLSLTDIAYTAINPERTKRSFRVTIRARRGEKDTGMTVDFYQLRQRREFVREMARQFGDAVERFEADLSKLQDACELRVTQPDLLMPESPVDPVPEGDKREAELLGKDPDLFGHILRDFDTLGIVGEADNIILSYLVMTSRRMSDPLGLMLISSPGTGKSAIAEQATDLCPPESRFDATHLSGKALFHAGAGQLKHKLISISENAGAEKANYSLRVLMSAKELTAVITAKDQVTGQLQAETKRVEGPAAVLNTSSDPNLDRETLTRYLVTHTNESREQTRKIQKRQREAHSEAGLIARAECDRIVRRHHAFQRLLRPVKVVTPKSLEIDYCDDRLNGRRDHPKVLNLLETVAFVRQMQKQVKQVEGIDYIEVDASDLAVAQPLIQKLFVARFDELSGPSCSLLAVLYAMQETAKGQASRNQFNDEGRYLFTRRQVREHSGFSKTALHRCFTELEEYEYVLRDTATRRRPFRYVLDWTPPRSTEVPTKVHLPVTPSTTAA